MSIVIDQSDLEAFVQERPKSQAAYERAKLSIGGGVVHDIRHIQPFPMAISRAAGSRKWDLDGHEYIDYHLGSAALLLGNAHPEVTQAVREQLDRGYHFSEAHEIEVDWAEAIRRLMPSCDRIRFTNSGTEATTLAVRIARAYSGKPKLLRFQGHYHGWGDWADPDLDGNGQIVATAGILKETYRSVVIIRQNDLELLDRTLEADADIGQVIFEPSGASWGRAPAQPEFAQQVATITHRHSRVLIMDEMISGFRWSPGGIQGLKGIRPDLTTMGKIATGGMPGGVVGGRAEVMDVLSFTGDPDHDRLGRVRHGGTFNGNPLSGAAALATLRLVATGEPTRHASEIASRIRAGLNQIIKRLELSGVAYGEASAFHLHFGPRPAGTRIGEMLWIDDAPTLKNPPKPILETLRRALQHNGIDLMSGMGGVVSAVHSSADVDQTLAGFERALTTLREERPELVA
jgi:glutamate-1-semialdehyde 2,1-aminomutase